VRVGAGIRVLLPPAIRRAPCALHRPTLQPSSTANRPGCATRRRSCRRRRRFLLHSFDGRRRATAARPCRQRQQEPCPVCQRRSGRGPALVAPPESGDSGDMVAFDMASERFRRIPPPPLTDPPHPPPPGI
jgi:hypothetical protein